MIMRTPALVFVDGSKTVIEVAGSILRQRLPAHQHNKIPRLIDRVSCSVHVGDRLDTVWRDLSPAQRKEIERELQYALAY